MAEFSGKIVSAFYADEEYADIKIRYEEDDKLFVYMVPNDPDNEEYQELVDEGWDHERLVDETAERLKAESRAYNIRLNDAAKALAQEMLGMKVLQDERDRLAAEKEKLGAQVSSKEETLIGLDKEVKIKTNQVDSAYFEHLWEMNENKEELFKFKLWALELEAVKNAGKDIKSSIRKATRISQGLAIIDSLM